MLSTNQYIVHVGNAVEMLIMHYHRYPITTYYNVPITIGFLCALCIVLELSSQQT